MLVRIAFLCLSVFLSALSAATPVAVITGAGDLDVNGRRLAREITGSVTLFNNDQVQTPSSTAVVWLGGSRLTVDVNSSFQLERKLGATELILRHGAVRFDTGSSRASLSIRAGDHVVTPDSNSEGAVILRPGLTAEAITLRGAASVVETSTGTYKRMRGQSGLSLAGSDGRMLFTGRTGPASTIQYVEHPLIRKQCPVSLEDTKHAKCSCPPPSDHTVPPDGDHNCGHGNGP